MGLLLDNAFQYLDPMQGIVDRVSGYPAEGWNNEPESGVFLRSFTQLTAIGAWIELLANVAAGYADNPYLSREGAVDGLSVAVASLLADQRNPGLSAKGLLANFIGLDGGTRRGPLVESIDKARLTDTFGEREGDAIWGALVQKGWLEEQDRGRKARIVRADRYGALHFDGALEPYSGESVKSAVMGLLDQRSVTIVFGDNANLTAALARSVGALLRPGARDDPKIARLREGIERFISGQREGYEHLFDPKTGTFVFGWDATADRFMGWDDGRGHWVAGQMNYFVNEFRGPWTFVVVQYGLPVASIRNAGFKIKPYRLSDGRDTYALAAWEGSAFQLLGLSLFMGELRSPGWRESLKRLVDVELDYSTRHGLPGFLSEAYSGNGNEYTGLIGIPDLAVTDKPLITDAPSLYTLGVAHGVAPDKVERFLEAQWPKISELLTPHGPWEGWRSSMGGPIRYQTTAHTLSLILGGIGSAQENMDRYLRDKGLYDRLRDLYRPGSRIDLLAAENAVLPWTSDGAPLKLSREVSSLRFSANLTDAGGMAFVTKRGPVSLSNGRLILRYGSETGVQDVSISFKRARNDPMPPPSIPVEIFARFERTEDDRIEIVLPPTPALTGIEEVSLAFRAAGERQPVDLSLIGLEFVPFGSALDSAN